jgi:hypothetical protein
LVPEQESIICVSGLRLTHFAADWPVIPYLSLLFITWAYIQSWQYVYSRRNYHWQHVRMHVSKASR